MAGRGGLITHHGERTVGHLIQLLFLWIHCDGCLWWARVHACPGDFLSALTAIPGDASAGALEDPNVRSMSMVPNHTPPCPSRRLPQGLLFVSSPQL